MKAQAASDEAKSLTRGFLDSRAVPFPRARPPSASAYAAWEREMDRLMRLDRRTSAEIVRLVRWLYAPDDRATRDALFWRANILCVPKLREKWDRLEANRAREQTNGKSSLARAAQDIQTRFDEHLTGR